jgi:PKD repeat protein/subtilisin family serine protease
MSAQQKRLSVILVLLLVLSNLFYQPASARSSPAAGTDYPAVSGRIIVKFRSGVQLARDRYGALHTGRAALDRLLASPDVRTERPLVNRPDPKDAIGLGRIYRLDLARGADAAALIAALAADPAVEYAEPDYIARAVTTPNDPLFPQQWGLTKINAPAAWDVVTGTQTVVIAIVDSGIDLTHPDLAGRLWVNPGEIPGNGLDDDNNGYVDDVNGWNFVHGTNNLYDGNGHGTQVAGVAAATANDGVGIAGLCWNCRIMPVRVMADSGVSNYSDIAAGVIYAADKGARVINLSLGGYAYSNALRDAVNYAVSKGAVVVGGAGNDNVAAPFYPAAYENVIAVAATDPDDHKVNFSNYGTWVDLSAPGAVITTTFLGGDWGPANGTSLSAPFVSGLAALILSRWPDWTPAMVRNQLEQTADPIDALNPAYAGLLGAGRINAAAALQEPHPVLTVAGTSVDGDPLGHPTPGMTTTLAVTLRNAWADATGVSGVLSTADPYVTVLTGTVSYGDIPAGATATHSPTYQFTTRPDTPYSHPIPFTLTVTANGGAYTATLPFTITMRSSDEHFCGTIAEDTTWTRDKTYILDCNVGIAPGYTLTIQAGTIVRVNGNWSLNVGGTLIADGTAAQPIRFMPHTPGGSWGRILFDDPSADAQATEDGAYLGGNLLRYVRIEGATQGISCTNATPYLDHVILTGGGMNCTPGSTPLWLQESDLSGDVMVFRGEVGFYDTPAIPYDVAVSGTYAYVADNSSGLRVIDISDPANPTEVGFYDTPGYANGVAVSGSYAYVADWISGLRVIDISNPAQPTEVGYHDTLATNVAVSGTYAYVAASAGLRVIDISDPTHPTEVGFYDTPGSAYGVAVSGPYAYVADWISGLRVIDISDPTHPTEVGFYDTPGSAYDVAISGSYAYVADHSSGLRVIDISNPANPTEVGFYDTPENAIGVAVSGTYAYVAAWISGLRVIDISDPAHPTEVGFYNKSAMNVAVSGPYAYVVGAGSGLRIFYTDKNAFVSRSIVRGKLSLPPRSEVLTSTVSGNLSAGFSSRVQNTTVGGSISIINSDGIAIGGYGIVQNNIVTGSITLGSGSVLTNTVTGGISVSGGGTVQGNNVEGAPGWGISAGAGSIVADNRLVGNASGIQVLTGTVRHNLIANTPGVGLQLGGSATAEHNTFTGIGGSAVKITGGTAVTLTGNNFEFNPGAYDVEDLVPKTTLMTVNARNNWWGTTSSAAIQRRIWDFNDDYNLGTVLYSPVLTEPSALAPAYVRAITLTPESPVGIQTVAFDVLFSREMNPEVAPALSFADYSGFYGGTWPAPNRYRAFYDFSTLVPRDTYTLTVRGAVGADGIQIAPHSATTFTVDYAGYINDTTPPPAPTVIACAAATPDTLSARWSASDPESTIDRYQYAIGLTPGGAEVVNWTFTTLTETTRTGLTLIAGQTYYVSVKARNEGGLWSVAGSVGVVAGSGGCSTNEPAPVASFEANPRSGPAPLTVVFTDTSTGTITAWEWAFGDGVTSTLHNPTHTYTTPGAYTVTLTVTGPGGSDTEMKANYITVTYPPPQADFTASPRSGVAPLEVRFTSTVTGAVTTYAWDFGDGGTGSEPNPTHTYQSAGSFGVTLVVTGPGGTAQVVKPGYITVSPPPSAPMATFSASVVSGTAPLTVTFTAVTSGTVEHWHWAFGDGAEAFTGPVVQHTYVTPGVFNVSLTVSNTYGSYTINKPGYITVNPPPGTAHHVYLPLVLCNYR